MKWQKRLMFDKLFEFKVTNLATAEQLVRDKWPTKVVSILSPRMKDRAQFSNSVQQVRLEFEDVDLQLPKTVCATQEDIAKMLEFTGRMSSDERLLVHCHYGISRSTAALIAILANNFVDLNDAFKLVEKLSPNMIPNLLVLQHADAEMFLGGELIKADAKWQIDKSLRLQEDMEEFWTTREQLDPVFARHVLRFINELQLKNLPTI